MSSKDLSAYLPFPVPNPKTLTSNHLALGILQPTEQKAYQPSLTQPDQDLQSPFDYLQYSSEGHSSLDSNAPDCNLKTATNGCSRRSSATMRKTRAPNDLTRPEPNSTASVQRPFARHTNQRKVLYSVYLSACLTSLNSIAPSS